MRAILNAIEAGAKRIISAIRIAERLDASRTLKEELESVNKKFPEEIHRNAKRVMQESTVLDHA